MLNKTRRIWTMLTIQKICKSVLTVKRKKKDNIDRTSGTQVASLWSVGRPVVGRGDGKPHPPVLGHDATRGRAGLPTLGALLKRPCLWRTVEPWFFSFIFFFQKNTSSHRPSGFTLFRQDHFFLFSLVQCYIFIVAFQGPNRKSCQLLL